MLNFWGINLHLYGLILGLGILLAREVVSRVAKERKLDEELLDKLLVVVLIGGVIGARLYHVLDNFSYYSENVVKIFMIWEGGLGIWGGIAGGIISAYCTLHIVHFRFKLSEIFDLGAVGLPLGQAIGRWGNFFNGEIIGRNGEPLFFYESLSTFILFLIIYRLRNKKKYKLMGIYLLGYGIIRLALEGFRNPGDAWMIGGLSVSTVLSLISVISGLLWTSSQSVGRYWICF